MRTVTAPVVALALALVAAASLSGGDARAEEIGRDAVVGGTTRVIGGDASASGQWPSVVALVHDGFVSPANRQFCGGTVLNSHWILTAAHCLYDSRDRILAPGDLRVIAGVTDLRAETPDEETFVTNLFVHPAYEQLSEEAHFDIALLELATAVDAPPVPLFRGDVEALGAAPVTVVGWGATSFTTPERATYPDALHQATVPLVSREVCNAPNSYAGLVGEGQLCAGFRDGGVDSCVGDSGGPLFVANGTGFEQLGVVSFGRGCAEPLFYGIYTSVPAYLDWIGQYVELPDGAAEPAGGSRGPSQPSESDPQEGGEPNPFELTDPEEPPATLDEGGGGALGGFSLVLLGLSGPLRRRAARAAGGVSRRARARRAA